jgi:hypothetical protein
MDKKIVANKVRELVETYTGSRSEHGTLEDVITEIISQLMDEREIGLTDMLCHLKTSLKKRRIVQ